MFEGIVCLSGTHETVELNNRRGERVSGQAKVSVALKFPRFL